MSQDDENSHRWIKEVMSKIIECLGPIEAQYKLVEIINTSMSSQHYVCVKFKNKTTDQDKELSIVLKRPTRIEGLGQISYSDFQFHNEILFYQMYARPDDNFARCIYADERPPIDSVIALENVNKRGYSPCSFLYNAPLEYTLAVMREIGRFHGKGYVMKKLQPEKFFDIVKRLQEVRYHKTSDSYKHFMNINAPRAVEYLRRHGHDSIFCDKMEALLSNAFDEVMMKIVKPLEPLSTLCHGDLILGNILFKTENDGQYRAMFIDFALLTYTTPIVDLSTYLCNCCSNEIRKDKFFEIMRAYHDALKQYLLEAGIWNIEKYSYDALLDDYRRCGLFGFVIASFFLPILIGYIKLDGEQIIKLSTLNCAKLIKESCGDEFSKILADMLLQLKDFGCLEHFL